MIAKTFFSDKNNILFCLEDLKLQVDTILDKYDFLMFSIHPEFEYLKANELIKKIFKTSDFIVFNAIDSFIDNNVKEKGIGLYAIKFENNGKINTFHIENFEDESVDKLSEYFNNNTNKFHLVFATFTNINEKDFIKKLSSKLTYYPLDNIAGGVASGYEVDGELRSMVFVDDKVIKEGLVVLSFENVEHEVGVALGFQPYGLTYRVSEVDDSRLYTVNNNKKMSDIINNLTEGIDDFKIQYLWYTPIYVLNKTDKNYHISSVRTIKNVTDEYVEFFSNIYEGEYFKISFATYEELLKEDKIVADTIMLNIKDIEFSMNFSCIARQYVLEDHQKEEIDIYTRAFNTHLFGFFTFGEIGPDVSYKTLTLYNETSLPVILKEK